MGNKAPSVNSKKVADILTPDEIRRFTNAFYIFDQAGDGKIDVTKIPAIMKALDYCLTNTEISTMVEHATTKKIITLNQFLAMQARRVLEQQVKEKVVVAYKNFEKCGNSIINFNDVRETMASVSGDLSPMKIEEMVREAVKGENEHMKCDEFIRVMAGH